MESRAGRLKTKYGISNTDSKVSKIELNTDNPKNPFLRGLFAKDSKATSKQNTSNKENVDAINHPRRKQSRKKKAVKEENPWDKQDDDEDNGIPNAMDDKKNLRRQLGSTRNIHFQLISRNLISLELDFAIEPAISDIFESFNAKLDLDTSLYIAQYEKYQGIMNALRQFEGRERITLLPITKIALSVLKNTSYKELSFIDDDGEETVIDYEDDAVKSIEDLPKHILTGLYPFQKEGVKFATENHGRILLADEMGVGKTIQAVVIAGMYKEDWPVLILCPGAVKVCWKNELLIWLKHLVKPQQIQVVNTGKEKFDKDAKFYILSYDLAVRKADDIARKKFKFIIGDEFHALKNTKSKRFEYLMPSIRVSKRLLLLSGTPILNKPREAFHVVHALRPDLFTEFEPFGERYCDPKPTKFGTDWSGVANTKELHFILNTMMIRRLKKDVLKDLPPKRRQKIEINCEPDLIKKIKQYIELRYMKILEKERAENGYYDRQLAQEIQDIKDNNLEEDKITFAEAFSMTGIAKLRGIRDYIKYLLDNDCKFIIFAYHIEVLDNIQNWLEEFYIEYIRIDGSVKVEDRNGYIYEFQNNENCRVAVLGITACATGITLTKASTVLFAELYFTPAIMIQAEDRAHRIGQEHSCVNIHYLYGVDTIDEIIFPRLRDKYFIVSTTLDDKKMELGLQKIDNGTIGDFEKTDSKNKLKEPISEEKLKKLNDSSIEKDLDLSQFKMKKRMETVEEERERLFKEFKMFEEDEDKSFGRVNDSLNLHKENGKRERVDDEDDDISTAVFEDGFGKRTISITDDN
jgi:SWI/SNF-related matrix-associated actin-dependent regulator 1 of chromatin subfamily A